MKINTQLLIDEVTMDFPVWLTFKTNDLYYKSAISSYNFERYNGEDYPIIVEFHGELSIIDKTGRIKNHKRWFYEINLEENNQTIIRIVAFTTKNKAFEVIRNTYPTDWIFEDCLTIQRMKKIKAIKDRINGKIILN